MIDFSRFMQRSFLKFGNGVASPLPALAIDGSSVRPSATRRRPGPVVAARWIGHECFHAEAVRSAANDNRPLAWLRRMRRRSNGPAVRSLRPVEVAMARGLRPDTSSVRPPGHGEIGRILVDGPIGSRAPSPDRVEATAESILPRFTRDATSEPFGQGRGCG